MSSIPPSYLYTFFAMLAISSLLVFSFIAYTSTVRFSSEVQQLKRLIDTIAAKSTSLITLALLTNATSEDSVQMPTVVGNRQYWLQLHNSSTIAWIEGGFGNIAMKNAGLNVYLPKEAVAEGNYIAGNGAVHLVCDCKNGTPYIRLEGSNTGE